MNWNVPSPDTGITSLFATRTVRVECGFTDVKPFDDVFNNVVQPESTGADWARPVEPGGHDQEPQLRPQLRRNCDRNCELAKVNRNCDN